MCPDQVLFTVKAAVKMLKVCRYKTALVSVDTSLQLSVMHTVFHKLLLPVSMIGKDSKFLSWYLKKKIYHTLLWKSALLSLRGKKIDNQTNVVFILEKECKLLAFMLKWPADSLVMVLRSENLWLQNLSSLQCTVYEKINSPPPTVTDTDTHTHTHTKLYTRLSVTVMEI